MFAWIQNILDGKDRANSDEFWHLHLSRVSLACCVNKGWDAFVFHMLIYMMFMWSYVIVLVVWFWTAKLYSKQLNLFISCVDDVHWLLSLHFGKSLVGCPFLEASYKDLVSARIFTWCMPEICWLCPPIMSPLTYQICRWYCITRWSTQLSGCYSGTQ